MKVLAAPSPTPAPTGRLREWNGGVPGHGEFVMLKTQPTHGSAPLEFSSKFGSRLWMIRQGTFPDTGIRRLPYHGFRLTCFRRPLLRNRENMAKEVTFKSEDEGDGTYEGQVGPVFVYDESESATEPVEVGWMTLAEAETYAQAQGLPFWADAPTREEWDEAARLADLPLWKRMIGPDK